MEKLTHLLVGVLVGMALMRLGFGAVASFTATLASILPDIDWMIDKAWISRESLIRRVWKRLTGRGFHRTLLHNIWIPILADSIIILIFGLNVALVTAFTLGYISHLALDSLTKTGIFWLWPIGDENITGRRRFHLNWRITTGKGWEKAIQIFLTILLTYIFIENSPAMRNLINKFFENLL